MRTIYLAGKVNGIKHKLAPTHQYVKYVSSDGYDHNDPHSATGFGWFNDPSLLSFVNEKCTGMLEKCDGLLAFVNTPDSYGTIAEIAYMSALKKHSTLIVITEPLPETEFNVPVDDAWLATNQRIGNMYDAYWLVSNFPRVTTVVVESNEEAAQKARCHIGNFLVESPIERLFWDTFIASGYPLLPVPQYQISHYRLDFAFPAEKIAVELDGHEYHKGVEQRSADAKRDRDLLKEGWTTLRFTGSDVHRNASGIVKEVQSFVNKMRLPVVNRG